ncbi:MAG TPA: proline dehydrogenase family protein [Gemmatimonadaceae bacterium]|nr:proline dehydrogenase family protein [Gemmatimonadaceae bacterium]
MLRQAFLYLSNQQRIFRFVRNNRFAKRLAQRFVAGETLDEAIRAVEPLNRKGITTSLDLLGESVRTEREAQAATREILTMLDRIHERRVQANVSLKLTQMGLDISEELCVALMHDVVGRARDLRTFIRIDMEDSTYTERTLRLFEDRLHPSYGDHVGIVLQSYLYRTLADVERAIAIKARVRLCKGAYKEPATVAYPEKADVDANYVRCMHKLLTEGNYPALATHDDRIIKEAIRFVRANGIGADRFEFQMLYGVRRDLQDRLVRDGWRVRVYVPFGTQWYPYLMRRLAERPSNIAFITGNVVREMVRR